MKESHRKDLASHPDPESCGSGRKTTGEALTGAHAGQPSSCEIRYSGVPTPLCEAEGHTEGGVIGKPPEDPAQSETLRMHGNPLHGKREIPRASAADGGTDRSGKVIDLKPGMHARGKSDDCVVPGKPPNNDGDDPSAEVVEGRRSTEGNALPEAASRTQSRLDGWIALQRVREVARRDKRARFTALLHHVTVDLLQESFYALKRHAAPGVDGLTWEQYEADLEDRIPDLHRRVQLGTYRAQPSRRSFIPKADGRMRPLCQFRSERAQLFRPACPPPEVVALVASNALLQRLRAFEATRACHKGVTGGALLTEIVAPKLPVTDSQMGKGLIALRPVVVA